MRTKALPLQALNNAFVSTREIKQVSLTIRTTAHSMSAISSIPNTRPLQSPDCQHPLDKALTNSVNEPYEKEPIHTRRWDTLVEVEIATLE